jgi:hypothetical protein
VYINPYFLPVLDTNLGTEVIQHSGGIDGYSCEGKDMPSPVIESLIKIKLGSSVAFSAPFR